MRDHEDIQHRADEKHDRSNQPEEQECDVRRMPAIAGHDKLLARGLLRQPFPKVEVFHHLGDELLRGLPQRYLFVLGETFALPLPDPLAFAGDGLHALGQSFAGEQRHHQRVRGSAHGNSGEHHGNEPCVVDLLDQKTKHAAPSEVEVDHSLHYENADGHPDHAANQHQLTGRMGPQQRDVVGGRKVDQQHDDRRQRADNARGRLGFHRHRLNLLGIFLRSRSTLDRLPKASDRLPPDFCWIAITIPKKFASGTGIRSNRRAHASPSGMPIAWVSMMARNSLLSGSGASVATTLMDSNSGRPALIPRTITPTASGSARRKAFSRRALRKLKPQRGRPKPPANAMPTAAINPPPPRKVPAKNMTARTPEMVMNF